MILPSAGEEISSDGAVTSTLSPSPTSQEFRMNNAPKINAALAKKPKNTHKSSGNAANIQMKNVHFFSSLIGRKLKLH